MLVREITSEENTISGCLRGGTWTDHSMPYRLRAGDIPDDVRNRRDGRHLLFLRRRDRPVHDQLCGCEGDGGFRVWVVGDFVAGVQPLLEDGGGKGQGDGFAADGFFAGGGVGGFEGFAVITAHGFGDAERGGLGDGEA